MKKRFDCKKQYGFPFDAYTHNGVNMLCADAIKDLFGISPSELTIVLSDKRFPESYQCTWDGFCAKVIDNKKPSDYAYFRSTYTKANSVLRKLFGKNKIFYFGIEV